MKCPSCGAEGSGLFCEYCGSEFPKEKTAKSVNQTGQINQGGKTIINNYYDGPPPSKPTAPNTPTNQSRWNPPVDQNQPLSVGTGFRCPHCKSHNTQFEAEKKSHSTAKIIIGILLILSGLSAIMSGGIIFIAFGVLLVLSGTGKIGKKKMKQGHICLNCRKRFLV